MKSLGSIRRAFAPWNDPAAKPYIVFERVTKPFGDFTAVERPVAGHLRARVLRAARRLGLRKDDAAQDARRLRGADVRPHPARRPGPARHPALSAAGQHDVPVLRAVPAHDRRAEHRLRPQAGGHAEARDRGPRRRHAEAGQARPVRQAQAAPAFRRPAAARGAGPLGRQAAQGAAARRAARRARQEAARGDPVRAHGPAAGARPDLRRRHPRPGGGDDHGRPHRHHGQGQGHAGGDAGRDLRGARLPLRRRLRRLGEHVRGHGRQPRGRTAPALPAAAASPSGPRTPAAPPSRQQRRLRHQAGEDQGVVEAARTRPPSTPSKARSTTSPISAT